MNGWSVSWATKEEGDGVVREWLDERQYIMDVINLLEKEVMPLQDLVSVTVTKLHEEEGV